MKRRLGAALFVAIVVAQLTTVAVILVSSQQFRHAAQDKETRLELERQSAETAAAVEDYLRPADEILRTTTGLLSPDVVDPDDLIPTLVSAMNQAEQLSELSIILVSGTSYTLRRVGDMVVLTVIRAPGGVGESWTRSFDPAGRFIASTEAVAGTYKQWSVAAVETEFIRLGGGEWGSPYVAFDSQKLVVGTSGLITSPSTGPTGLVRAIVELAPVSASLATENLGGGVVFNDSGYVLAHTDPELAQPTGRYGLEPRHIDDIDDAGSRVSLGAVLDDSGAGTDGIVHVSGTETTVATSTIRAGSGTWSIVLYGSPQDVLPETVADNNRETRFMRTVGFLAVFLTGCVAYPGTKRLRTLQRHATTDNLTGLANRRSIIYTGKELLKHSRIGIIAIDVDHFKQVNDSFGHIVGDEVLVEVARRITSCIRRSDHAGRVGGEEFLVIFRLDNPSDLPRLAKRMHQTIGTEPYHTKAGVVRVTASFGTATGDTGREFTHLLASADAAMYQAKQAGRNRIVSAENDDGHQGPGSSDTTSRRKTDQRRTISH